MHILPKIHPLLPLFVFRPFVLGFTLSRPLKVKYKMWSIWSCTSFQNDYLSFQIYRENQRTYVAMLCSWKEHKVGSGLMYWHALTWQRSRIYFMFQFCKLEGLSLFVWLVYWNMLQKVSKSEISDLSCFDVEKEIQLSEFGKFELICHLRPLCKEPENIQFTTTNINNCMRGTSPRILEELYHHSLQAGPQGSNCSHWIGTPKWNKTN